MWTSTASGLAQPTISTFIVSFGAEYLFFYRPSAEVGVEELKGKLLSQVAHFQGKRELFIKFNQRALNKEPQFVQSTVELDPDSNFIEEDVTEDELEEEEESKEAEAEPAAAAAASSSSAAPPRRTQSQLDSATRAFLLSSISSRGITLRTRWNGDAHNALQAESLLHLPGSFNTHELVKEIKEILLETAADADSAESDEDEQ